MFNVLSRRQPLLASSVFFVFFLFLSTAFAARPAPDPEPTLSPLATDLAALVSQGQAVDAQLAGIDLTAGNSCTELGAAGTSIGDWLAAMETVYAGITTSFSVDVESLTSLDELSNLAVTIAARVQGFSLDLNSISTSADLVEYDASLAAILSLSDDIGSMADRIGEMADRMLIMADNIGLMADRILITQQLQSANVITTQNSILTTQMNAIALSNTLSTQLYDPMIAALVNQANALATSMDLVWLNQLNMSTELARIETEMSLYLTQVVNLYTLVSQDSAFASHYTNGDTLTWAGDLSGIHRALALALETYADTINQLAPTTSTPVLASATDSMLSLTYDIGVMSDRIMEMVDRIVAMADNIGAMSGRIVDTQNIQQTNIEFTEASLLSASGNTINVIAAYGL